MKKFIWSILIGLILASCSKGNCEEQEAQAYEDYQKALGYANGSSGSASELNKRYNEKLAEIQKDCD